MTPLEIAALTELTDAAWDFKTEITSAMIMDRGGTLRNLYAGLLNRDRLDVAHHRLLAAITKARAMNFLDAMLAARG